MDQLRVVVSSTGSDPSKIENNVSTLIDDQNKPRAEEDESKMTNNALLESTISSNLPLNGKLLYSAKREKET